jgi:ABC-2 type transport system permease protein
MRSWELAKRNFKEVWRDPLSLGITIGLPVVLLLILQALKNVDSFFEASSLVPGIVLFGFVMLMFSAAMSLSRDRESALFARLLTAPIGSTDFVAAYSLPYLVVAVLLGLALFVIGLFLGLTVEGSVVLVFLIVFVMAIFYVAMGMLLGALLPLAPLSGAYAVVLLLTVFGGAWMDLQAIGGVFLDMGQIFPFAHALDATRAVMIDGAGFADIATDFYWVAGYTVVIVLLAVFFFRRKMLE